MTVATEPEPEPELERIEWRVPSLPLPQLRRGWAKGKRRDFLDDELPEYSLKRALGPKAVADCVVTAVNKWFHLFHWCLPVDRDPSPADVFPDDEQLSQEDFDIKAAVINQFSTAIKNWLDYHWLEGGGSALTLTKKKIASNPIAAFLQQLTTKEPAQQRALTAHQLWSKENLDGPLKGRFESEFEASGLAKKNRAAAQARFVAERFAELSKEEQKEWKAKALKDMSNVRHGKEEVVPGPSLLPPAEAQKAIDNMGTILYPLAEGISKMIGMQVHMVLAGPEPRMGSQLNIIGLHEGLDKSAVPRRFEDVGGERGAERYRFFLAALGDYLMMCYSEDDQRARALPSVPFPTKPPGFLRTDVPWNDSHRRFDDVLPGVSEDGDMPGRDNSGSVPRRKQPRASEEEEESAEEEQLPETKKKKGGKTTSKTKETGEKVTKGGKGKRKARTANNENTTPVGAQQRSVRQVTVPRVSARITGGQAEKARASDGSSTTGQRQVLLDITNTIPPQPLTAVQAMQIDPALLAPGTIPGSFVPNCGPNDCPNPFAPLPPASPAPSEAGVDDDTSSSAEAAPVGVMDPVNWAPWFRQARLYLGRFKLGGDWDSLLLAFTLLEGKRKFATGGKGLRPDGRPAVVGTWIQNARNRDPKKLGPVAAYAASWWAWWRSLQPEWRGLTGVGPITEAGGYVGGRWPELDIPKSGVNGMYSVIASLAWWGAVLGDGAELKAEWALAVADVTWVITSLSR
ncbi:hypothetical protein ARMSODRAFT_1021796 [Armillaria solidipes]|uniref:Uncharacterized protein n=1 Tax=Armillaria solidipes TaxID=1076256 RepID=A0A2H3BT18_9AGAR|nr:hypothetical protein ARMSODRAFT_1021796 [Armillaria solidipes]